MPTSPTAPTAVPDFPAIGDASYNTKAYNWATHMDATYPTEMQALATNVYNNAVEANADAATATTKAAEATAAASAATATANASSWVNGGTYAMDANAISGIDHQTYRKKTASSVTITDPSADSTNWVGLSGLPAQSGNSGKYLKTDGSVSSWSVVPSGLTLLATLTPTAASNVDFLTTFSGTYNNYLIAIEGVKPATDDAGLRMRFAVAGSVDTGSNYFIGVDGSSATATSAINTSNTTTAAGAGASGLVQIQNANGATQIKNGFVTAASQLSANVEMLCKVFGYTASNAISGFRLYWATGSNFTTSGTIRVYGYANT